MPRPPKELVPRPPLTVDEPFADMGHEAIRQWVKSALASGERGETGVADTYFLTDLLFELLDDAFTAVDAAQAAIDDLTARVTALEPAPEPPTPTP